MNIFIMKIITISLLLSTIIWSIFRLIKVQNLVVIPELTNLERTWLLFVVVIFAVFIFILFLMPNIKS